MKKASAKACPMCSGHYGKATIHPYTPEQVMKLQSATFNKLQRLLKGLKPRQLAWRSAEGKWSIKEVVAHLADTELVYGFRYRKILAESQPEASAFDQDLWTRNLNSDQRDLKSTLEMFKAVRQNNLDLMKLAPTKSWQRAGTHPEYGQLTFAQLAFHLTMHDVNHLKQIRTIRQEIQARD